MDSIGYLVGAALLLYLARLMLRRHARQPGEPQVFALVVATAIFHAGRLLSQAASYSSLAWIARTADAAAFGALALLPALLLHAHLVVAVEAVAGTASVRLAAIRDMLQRCRSVLLVITYAPLVLLPVALYRLASGGDPDPLVRLSGFERWFLIWILWAHAVAAIADLILARHARRDEQRRLFFGVGVCFALNAALFVVTFFLGGRELPGIGDALVSLSFLSSIVPALVFAYFIYRYNALGLIVRRGAVAAAGAAILMAAYVFLLEEASARFQRATGIDARIVEAILLAVVLLALAPFAARLRGVVFRFVFPDLARQRALSREVGSSLHKLGDRAGVARHIGSALTTAFAFDRAELRFPDDGDPMFDRIPRRAPAIVRAEVADERLAADMDRHRATAVVPVWRASGDRPASLLIVGYSPAWPLTSAADAAPLVQLAQQIAIALDHVEIVEANVALDRQLQQEKHLAAIGRLAATVAHEVKNPLGAIKTIVQVMQEQQRDDPDLRMIVSEIDRLAATVNQLLAFARLSQEPRPQGPQVAQVPGNPTAALRNAAGLFQTELSLDPKLEAGRIRVAGVSTDQLSEVLSNLVVNAQQAGARRIRMTAAMNGHALRLEVEDDGEGIPVDRQATIFEPFFTTRQRGTGLGLAIVHQRIQSAGGTIAVRSPVLNGRGTRFSIELPALEAPEQ